MDYYEIPNHLGRLSFCQACDLFPVDMGINIAPLQERINECKRRYHRDVWRILCDGAAGCMDASDGRHRVSYRDFDAADKSSVDNKLTVEDDIAVFDAQKSKSSRKLESKVETRDLPADDMSKQPTSTNASPSENWTESLPSSRKNRRTKLSVSIGGVSGSSGCRGCVGWAPIESQLDKLRDSLASDSRGSGSSSSSAKRMMAPVNSSATPTTKPVTQSAVAVGSSAVSESSQSQPRKQRARTLNFTLIIDPTKQELITVGGNKSFKTLTVSTESTFVPLRCGDWAHVPPSVSPTHAGRTAATRASTKTASQRHQQLRSQTSKKQMTAPV